VCSRYVDIRLCVVLCHVFPLGVYSFGWWYCVVCFCYVYIRSCVGRGVMFSLFVRRRCVVVLYFCFHLVWIRFSLVVVCSSYVGIRLCVVVLCCVYVLFAFVHMWWHCVVCARFIFRCLCVVVLGYIFQFLLCSFLCGANVFYILFLRLFMCGSTVLHVPVLFVFVHVK